MKDLKWEKKVDDFLEKIEKIQRDTREKTEKEFQAKIDELEKINKSLKGKIDSAICIAVAIKMHTDKNTNYSMKGKDMLLLSDTLLSELS